MSWQQFSIGGKYPMEEVKGLSEYKSRWHFLFEPQLLVRVEDQRISLPEGAIWGDSAKSSPSGDNGRFFHGEKNFYSEELWQANADFLAANSRLVKVLLEQGKNSWPMQRKHVHLLCNQFGMNYLREFKFYLRCACRSLYLYMRHGGI